MTVIKLDLHHGEYGDGGGKNQPEIASGVCRFQDGEDDGGDKTEELQVGHHVEGTDEQSQSYCQREVDNQEADAEQDTYAERHESLSAEVAVHALLHVVQQAGDERAVFLRDKVDPSFGNAFVIQQDEDDVEQNQEEREEAEQQVDGFGKQRPYLGYRLFEGIQEAFLSQQLVQELDVDVFF